MRNESLETMLRVRHAIEPSETLNGQALGQLGLLLHTACEAQRTLGVDHRHANPILADIVAAATKQVEVQRCILSVHDALATIGREAMPGVMQGDHGCPPQKQLVQGAASLHLVEAALAA